MLSFLQNLPVILFFLFIIVLVFYKKTRIQVSTWLFGVSLKTIEAKISSLEVQVEELKSKTGEKATESPSNNQGEIKGSNTEYIKTVIDHFFESLDKSNIVKEFSKKAELPNLNEDDKLIEQLNNLPSLIQELQLLKDSLYNYKPEQINTEINSKIKEIDDKLSSVETYIKENITVTDNREFLENIKTQIMDNLKQEFSKLQNFISQEDKHLKKSENLLNIEEENEAQEEENISDKRPELSDFAKRLIKEYNNKNKSVDIATICSSNIKRLGVNNLGEQNIELVDENQGVFWGIEEANTGHYLLVLNQERLKTEKTFGLTMKSINRVFDCHPEYDEKKHKEFQITYPAIVNKSDLKLEVRGKIEFLE